MPPTLFPTLQFSNFFPPSGKTVFIYISPLWPKKMSESNNYYLRSKNLKNTETFFHLPILFFLSL